MILALFSRPLRYPLLALFVALLVAASIACRGGDANSPSNGGANRLSVVTSIHPMEYFVQRVGGDMVDVTNLVPPGVEAHGFEPSARDLQRLAAADMVVLNGLELEPWLHRALATLGANAPRVIVEASDVAGVRLLAFEDDHGHDHGHGGEGHVESPDEAIEEIDRLVHEVEGGHMSAEGALERIDHIIHDLSSAERNEAIRQIDRVVHDWEDGRISAEDAIELIEDIVHDYEHGHGHENDGHENDHGHGEFDPHVWLDPLLAIVQVERIRDALIELAPQHGDLFRTNAQTLVDELRDLHSRFESTLSSCLHDHFVTTHSAYAYLATRYGLEQVPITGLTPDAEPSAQRLAQISDQVRELGLRYILVEPVLGTRLADTVRREAGVELLAIHQIESITTAELSEHGDYMGLMENNLRSLSIALECG